MSKAARWRICSRNAAIAGELPTMAARAEASESSCFIRSGCECGFVRFGQAPRLAPRTSLGGPLYGGRGFETTRIWLDSREADCFPAGTVIAQTLLRVRCCCTKERAYGNPSCHVSNRWSREQGLPQTRSGADDGLQFTSARGSGRKAEWLSPYAHGRSTSAGKFLSRGGADAPRDSRPMMKPNLRLGVTPYLGDAVSVFALQKSSDVFFDLVEQPFAGFAGRPGRMRSEDQIVQIFGG